MSATAVLPPSLKTDDDLAEPKPATKAKPRREEPRPEPVAETKPPQPSDRVRMGHTVLWQQPGGDWWPAIVRRVNGDGTLRLTVFSDNPIPLTGAMCARHVSDTSAVTPARAAYGVWDFVKE